MSGSNRYIPPFEFETHQGSRSPINALSGYGVLKDTNSKHSSKAVADGAVIWSIANSVPPRAPRYSFGVICARFALLWMEGREGRKMYMGARGLPIVRGVWSQIVHKSVALDAEAVCRETYTDDEPGWAWDKDGDHSRSN
ncbi:hypothetical protein B0J17DRAFT_629473 [Rhizoctonia solani]|nr:hypothetical protein B0J17DRAFT_629473 [Rhizoctonia solani]